jgi:hypothetical protein
LTAVAESPPIAARAPHRPDTLAASPAMGGSNHSSGFEAVGESLHRSEFERSLEASTRYSELGDETSERESGASVRDPTAGGRDVEKELLEKLQLERRHAGLCWPEAGIFLLATWTGSHLSRSVRFDDGVISVGFPLCCAALHDFAGPRVVRALEGRNAGISSRN